MWFRERLQASDVTSVGRAPALSANDLSIGRDNKEKRLLYGGRWDIHDPILYGLSVKGNSTILPLLYETKIYYTNLFTKLAYEAPFLSTIVLEEY